MVTGPETLVVERGGFEMDDPWTAPASSTPVRLRRAVDGAPPRLATSVAAWFDDHHLSFLFSAADDHIEATLLEGVATDYVVNRKKTLQQTAGRIKNHLLPF